MNASDLWAEYPNIPAENKWRMVRTYRNSFLSQSDWTELPSAVLTFDEKTAWAEYRQALRDIPQDFIDPDSVIFPETP